ncbi:hypothetical protein [Enterococcus faecium]|uniref:hypothetical protein n=1 Tax=Enterococcus faecium TaxID=1352 RepID=UPI000BEFF83C|nr:hypothetical protein [Enterococcus faecium]PEH49514.1 hypothetical protein CRM75_01795 [Enterococcus faecium]
MNKKFEIRKRGSYEAKDPELNHLASIVDGNLERKKVAVTKNGFDYFQYKNSESFKELKAFCAPYKLQKTKKYSRNGLVNFLSPSGAKAIIHGDYVVKLNETTFIVLDEAAFNDLFVVKWAFISR